MKSRIDQAFQKREKKAFIPFTVLGYPDRSASRSVIQAMIDGGATALELGLAFSDPMADGPIIEDAARHVVANAFKTTDAFSLLAEVREDNPDIPIILMTYYNLILAPGAEVFFEQMSAAQIDGITIVDLPPEESKDTYRIAREHAVAPVMLVSPLTSEARLASILEQAGGYIYLVSRAGVTGLDSTHDARLKSIITMLRGATDLPVCIGFGISNASQARGMLGYGADGIIIGSRIVSIIDQTQPEGIYDAVREFSKGIVEGISSPSEAPADSDQAARV